MSVFYSLLEFLLPKAVELRVVATELMGVSRTSFVLVSYFLHAGGRVVRAIGGLKT